MYGVVSLPVNENYQIKMLYIMNPKIIQRRYIYENF